MVYLHGHADLVEQPLLDRAELGTSVSAELAVAEALRVAGVGLDEVSTFDLYSCFSRSRCSPCATPVGWATDDPRGLTLTGGLPFFGGPGNSYSLHGIARRC